MIVYLPRDVRSFGGPIGLPKEDPYLSLRTVKGDVYMQSTEGKLVGQILFDEGCATVSVGDAQSYCVTKNGGKIAIDPFAKEGGKIRYEVFGNTKELAYTLYQYRAGVIQPVVAARVTPDPIDRAFYYADLSDDCNVFRTLLFAVAIADFSR